jgi:SAM-dependent methyltransferase
MILTLKSLDELSACRRALAARGLDFTDPGRARLWRWMYAARFRRALPPADPMKSWDVARSVEVVEREVPDRDAPVLDMGCFNSEIVYALSALGYRRVHGCDLNPLCHWLPYWDRIAYTCADLTKTPYPDGFFGAITCLSVVEHGVPPEALAAEADRLLRPGGVLILTTDFDAVGGPHEIDPEFRVFGQSWRIFDPAGLSDLLAYFHARKFTALDPSAADLSHTERPIGWKGRDYTFALAALRKSG